MGSYDAKPSTSAYETYDQAANVAEWQESAHLCGSMNYYTENIASNSGWAVEGPYAETLT